ncbi:nitronate monooxygenase [Pigmentiphaga sp. NML080357]|uniref:NAD(P)H-dependent flavin oxidoreductase n=1 Tax=Pigmentiphaga sp. NML080357 TaxID=2008675 RepID=UPI000B4107D5|nr:nitronate monooxygenase [Pigmentiphaga sp. NML080357]OVZ59354.1 nitronate monooxygenase [Pigmentiphaga sp. NML080357]
MNSSFASPAPALDTPITRLFGIRYPVLLGGMMWLSDASLVAAAVNAGAMGFITARSSADAAAFRDQLQKCRALTGGRPYGVNLTLSRRQGANDGVIDMLRVALDEGVRHFETAGLPPAPLLPALREAGAVVIHKCAHIRHAVSAERMGVDAVALVGMEEGGHPGANQLPTFVNGAFALDRLSIPLALGGGIGHGRQIAAALAMGADAVVMGSRFTTAAETPAHPAYKQRVVEADEHCSRAVLSSLGDTWRVLDNENARRVAQLESEGARTYEAFGELIRGHRARDYAYARGLHEEGMLSLGPAAGFSQSIEPFAQTLQALMKQCRDALLRGGRLAGMGA